MKKENLQKDAKLYSGKKLITTFNHVFRKGQSVNISREKTQKKKSFFDKFQKIGFKLFAALFIPVILIAIFGLVSYKMSETALINNYTGSVSNTLNSLKDFFDFGLTGVSEKSLELAFDSDVIEYYNTKDNAFDLQKSINNKVLLAKDTNSFISNVMLFSEKGKEITTFSVTPRDVYNTLMETELGDTLGDKTFKYMWVSEHKDLDEKQSNNFNAYNTDLYALSLIRKINKIKGYIVVDISKEQIMKILSNCDMGDKSVLGFVTEDGREILLNTDETSVFSGTQFYQDSISSQKSSDTLFIDYNGDQYLYLYNKLEDIGVTLCAMVPKTTILTQVSGIKSINMVFTAAACILAIAMALIIAGGMLKAITSLRKSILLASEGDLTAGYITKRKDEFLVLSNGISHMLSNMSSLIGKVQDVGSTVSNSAGDLLNTSESLLTATKDISYTLENIGQGIVQQAGDTEQCLQQMNGLSEQINQLFQNTYEIEQIAANTKSIAGKGILIVDELSDKSKATSNITHDVIKKIKDFEAKSQNIGEFVTIINDIASQTNLLSLNATIEAARAGSAGKGFAVVADEIRRLADQSVKAASHINNIVNEILSKTKDTLVTAKDAENIVTSQSESLDKTVIVFNDINEHVNNLVSNLQNIIVGISNVETAKESTLLSIESISAVSEETAAATEELSATSISQIGSADNLRKAALELANDAKNLEESIKRFKIN